MDANKHAIGGLVTAATVYYLLLAKVMIIFSWKSLLLFALVAVVYALLPDADLKNSEINWIILWIVLLAVTSFIVTKDFNMIYIAFGLLIFVLLVSLFPHRGFIHSIWFGGAASIPLYFILGWQYVAVAFCCFCSHKILDMSSE